MLNFSRHRLALIAIFAVALAGCPSALGPARKTTAAVMYATNTMGKAVAAPSVEKHALCLRTHGKQTTAYATCIAEDLKRLTVYRDVIRPAARSAVATSYAAIRIADEAGKKDLDYMKLLKPGACALIIGLREWAHRLPEQGKTILPLLTGFLGVACDKPNGAIGLITALLPVAVDLVRWIVQLVGVDSSQLEREIYAWITAKPADEVDAVLATIQAALPVAP